MLFPLFTSAATAANSIAAGAAIKCLLAYTHGFEDCLIDVEIAQGVVMLTGTASSQQAARNAISLAADFTSMPVICNLRIASVSQPA
ncbi:BON domain-containing protein [Rhizobium sp. 2MFCol3.1]|uniref:BON domain-containing protein n=1 Tax=unclassified Rhizobium TaxID=2613769 RepID=UPI000364AF25|nr:BON domain-containing protein [Rhizobium sp. 2MFCol3.1]